MRLFVNASFGVSHDLIESVESVKLPTRSPVPLKPSRDPCIVLRAIPYDYAAELVRGCVPFAKLNAPLPFHEKHPRKTLPMI